MRRSLSRRGQLALAIGQLVLVALGVPLAWAQFHDEKPLGAVFILLMCFVVGWGAVGRLRTIRGRVEPMRTKALRGALVSINFGVASALMALASFGGKTFRGQVGSVGGDVLGVLWAIGAVCFIRISWMAWTRDRPAAEASNDFSG